MSDLISGSNISAISGNVIDSVIPNNVSSSKTLVPFTDRVVVADPSGGDIDLTLPDATSNNGVSFYIKRANNGANVLSLLPGGSDTIDGGDGEILGNENEFVSVISNGTARWQVLTRRTFAVAVLQYIGTTTTQGLTTSDQLVTAWNTDGFSTPGRIVTDVANNRMDVLDIKGSVVDNYDLKFNGSFRYANGQDVTFTVYVDGVATSLATKVTGDGANDVPFSVDGLISVLNSGGTPQSIELWARATSVDTITYNTGFTMSADRIGG